MEQVTFCRGCGQEMQIRAVRCQRCGLQRRRSTASSDGPLDDRPWRSMSSPVSLIAVGLVGLVIGIAVLSSVSRGHLATAVTTPSPGLPELRTKQLELTRQIVTTRRLIHTQERYIYLTLQLLGKNTISDYEASGTIPRDLGLDKKIALYHRTKSMESDLIGQLLVVETQIAAHGEKP